MATTPEGKVKAKVKKILDEYGVYHFSPATGGYGVSGIPDIVGCFHGKFIAIECKAGDNKPTALQERQLYQIQRNKGHALVINETNYVVLELLLKEIKAGHPDLPPDNLTSSLDKKKHIA
jgi:Holliday junction resolvase